MQNGSAYVSLFRGWYARLEDLMREFESAERRIRDGSDENDDDNAFKDLIARALEHYEQYFVEESRIGQHKAFLLFSPPWLSRLERALLWIAGFKPSLVFRIVSQAVRDLSPDQTERLRRVMDETKMEERALCDDLARFNESVGSHPVVGLARRYLGRQVDGETDADEAAAEKLGSVAQALVANADMLRSKVGREVVGILSPPQSVRFLAAGIKFQLRIRGLGVQRDGESS